MGIVSWLVLGAIVGLLANWYAPGKFPGGLPGTLVGGLVGGFIGGALFALIAGRGVASLDPPGLVIAFIVAALVLALARKAEYGDGQ